MSIAGCNFLNIADAINESGDVDRAQLLVSKAKLAVDIAAHRINIAAIFGR